MRLPSFSISTMTKHSTNKDQVFIETPVCARIYYKAKTALNYLYLRLLERSIDFICIIYLVRINITFTIWFCIIFIIDN